MESLNFLKKAVLIKLICKSYGVPIKAQEKFLKFDRLILAFKR